MTNEIKKCPNCAHVFKDEETYCPNCDLFVPVSDLDEQSTNNDVEQSLTNEKSTEHLKIDIEQTEKNTEAPTFKHRHQPDLDETKEEIDANELEAETIISPVLTTAEEDISIDTTTTEENIVNTESVTDTPQPEKKVKRKKRIPDEEPSISAIAPATPKVEKTKEPNQKRTINILIGIIIILVIGGGWYIYDTNQTQKKAEEALVIKDSAKEAVDTLFLNGSNEGFLKVGLTSEELDSAKKKVEAAKDLSEYSELKEEYETAEAMFIKEKAINDSFNENIINGDELNKDAYVVNNTPLTVEKIEPETTGFDKLYNEAVKEAVDQKKALKDMKDTMDKLFRDDKVVSEPSSKIYNEATKQVKEIKNPEIKKEYETNLAKVKTVIDDNEAKAARIRQEQEEQAAAIAQAEADALAEQERQKATQKQEESYNTNQKTTPPTTTGRWGNREDSSIDLSNSAWAWGDGVQSKFISEVISRGYVVDGGYSLVPKFIENGEGYYDLYATTNSKLFPKDKADAFPIYVVTVNAKTGWFKGNGSK